MEQGEGEQATIQLRQGIDAYRTTGAESERSHWLVLLAEAYGRLGQTEEGLKVLAGALAEVHQNGIHYCKAELYRLKGELTLQSSVQSLESKQQKNVFCKQ